MSEKTDADKFCHDLLNEKQLKLHSSLPKGLLSSLSGIFANDTPEIIKTMRQFLADNDLEKLASEAHGLKGAAMTIGAKTLPQLCAELQKCAKDKNSIQSRLLLDEIDDCFYKTCVQLEAFLKNSSK